MTPFEPARVPKGASGFLLLDPNADLNVYTPSWNDPMYYLPVGSPQPGLSPTHDDNWYHRVPDLVRSVGTRRRISFLNTPSDLETSDVEPTPYDLLHHTVWGMSIDTHPQWQRLFVRKGFRRPALSNPNWSLFIQGMLYGYPDVPYWNDPICGAMMVLSPELAMAVQKLLPDDETVEQFFDFAPGSSPGNSPESSPGSSPDTGPAEGVPNVLRFYRHAQFEQVPGDWDMVRALPARMVTGRGRGRMLCQIVRPAQGVHLSFPPPAQRALTLRPWGNVVRRLTMAQQLRCLATAFEPDLIRTVFMGTRYEPDLTEWLAQAPHATPIPTG